MTGVRLLSGIRWLLRHLGRLLLDVGVGGLCSLTLGSSLLLPGLHPLAQLRVEFFVLDMAVVVDIEFLEELLSRLLDHLGVRNENGIHLRNLPTILRNPFNLLFFTISPPFFAISPPFFAILLLTQLFLLLPRTVARFLFSNLRAASLSC